MIGHHGARTGRPTDPAISEQATASRLGPITAAVLSTCAVVLLALGCAVGGGLAHDHNSEGYRRLAADEPAAPFNLVNQEQRRISLADLAGKAVVLTFTYTNCTDICPMLIHTLDRAGAMLTAEEKERVRFIAISIDPRRDTPARLKAFLDETGLDPKVWHLLTGTVEEITRVTADYGVVARPEPHADLVHNSVFVFIDPAGREKAELHGVAAPSEAVVDEIRALWR